MGRTVLAPSVFLSPLARERGIKRSMGRITDRFSELKQQGRKGLVTFVTAGDPDYDRSLAVLKSLPGAGADFVELGMPFSDPMADGPAIQASSLRALEAGACMKKTLEMVRAFRQSDARTPLILMGYFNPVYVYGAQDFVRDAAQAGADGLIIVDLPPEEDAELRLPAQAAGLDFIRLVTPTTDAARLERLLAGASGFLYYVSITGITGAASAQAGSISDHVTRIRASTDLPLVIGFGIKSPQAAAEIAPLSDAVVVGSSLVQCVANDPHDPVQAATGFVSSLRAALYRHFP